MERETLHKLLDLDKKIQAAETLKGIASRKVKAPITLEIEHNKYYNKFRITAYEAWGSMLLSEESTNKIAKLIEESIDIELTKLKEEFNRIN